MTVSAKNIVLATGGRPKYPTHVSIYVCIDEHVQVLFSAAGPCHAQMGMRQSECQFRYDIVYSVHIQKLFVLEIHLC